MRSVKFALAALSLAANLAAVPQAQLLARIAKRGDVRLTAGDYVLSSPVTLLSGTHLHCAPGAVISDRAVGTPLAMMLRLDGHNISIEGCVFRAYSSMMIVSLASNTFAVSLSHNSFRGSGRSHGVLLDSPGLHDIDLTSNNFMGLAYGILQNVHAFDIQRLSIRGNTFRSLSADGVELNNPVTSDCCGVKLTSTASDIAIVGNSFDIPRPEGSNLNSGFCVGVAGARNVRIVDNRCNAWNEGIHVEDRASGIYIADNDVTTNDSQGHPDQAAIAVIDGTNIRIEHNTINNAISDGIHIDYDLHHQVKDIRVVRNMVTNCGERGIYMAGGSLGAMHAEVSGNTVKNCAVPLYLSGELADVAVHDNSFLSSGGGCGIAYAPNVKRQNIQFNHNEFGLNNCQK